MSRYIWQGSLFGLAVFALAAIVFAFGPLAVAWSFTPQKGEFSILKGVIVPALSTALVGTVIGLWLEKKRSQRRRLVYGFLLGGLFFFILVLLSLFVSSFLKTTLISFVYLPGVFLSDTLLYPLLSYLRGEIFLFDSKEPLLVWTAVTFSWLAWGFLGAAIGHLLGARTNQE